MRHYPIVEIKMVLIQPVRSVFLILSSQTFRALKYNVSVFDCFSSWTYVAQLKKLIA